MAISKRLRYEILRRDNHRCRYCGAAASNPDTELTIDHVLPRALGGDDKPDNLVAACVDCNAGKTSSHPDAPFVADVADDAVRWSRALAAAGAEILAEMKARDDVHQTFADAWGKWTYEVDGVREHVPMDPSWRESVDALLGAGLPMAALVDAVNVAMTRDNVKHENRFRYMCGVAWRKVDEIRERAGKIVSSQKEPAQGEDEDLPAVPGSVLEAAKELLDVLHDDERESYLNATAAEYGDVDETALHYLALDKAMEALTHQRWMLERALQDVLTLYSDEEVDRQLEASRQKHLDLLGETPSYADTLSQTVLELTCYDRATAYLSRLPEPEREEWSAVARTYLGPEVDERDAVVFAAEHAQYNKRIEPNGQICVLRGMCLARGDHGAHCPSRAEHLVFVDACGEDPCAGHEFCDRHLELLLAGEYISRKGHLINVHDFTDLPDADSAGAAETNTKGE